MPRTPPPSPCNYKKSNLCFIQGSDSFGCWLFLNKHDKSNTLTSPGVIFQNGDPAERNEMFSQVYFMQIYIQTNYMFQFNNELYIHIHKIYLTIKHID